VVFDVFAMMLVGALSGLILGMLAARYLVSPIRRGIRVDPIAALRHE
jgi:hypothetical protein